MWVPNKHDAMIDSKTFLDHNKNNDKFSSYVSFLVQTMLLFIHLIYKPQM